MVVSNPFETLVFEFLTLKIAVKQLFINDPTDNMKNFQKRLKKCPLCIMLTRITPHPPRAPYHYTPVPLNLAHKQQTTTSNKQASMHFCFLLWLLLRVIASGSTLL